MRQRDCTLIHDSWPALGYEGNFFSEFKTKNAKNHEISLLQMQGCPQSNAKKK
jgi:hypothetical protein